MWYNMAGDQRFRHAVRFLSRQAVTNGQVSLGNYNIVIWECGTSLTNTFRAPERT